MLITIPSRQFRRRDTTRSLAIGTGILGLTAVFVAVILACLSPVYRSHGSSRRSWLVASVFFPGAFGVPSGYENRPKDDVPSKAWDIVIAIGLCCSIVVGLLCCLIELLPARFSNKLSWCECLVRGRGGFWNPIYANAVVSAVSLIRVFAQKPVECPIKTMDPDIGGIGVRIGLWLPMLATVVSLVLGLPAVSGLRCGRKTGTKE